MSAQLRVAVLLSGCGHLDGAEVREAVLTLLALDQHGAQVQCVAPDAEQFHVVDHRTGQPVAGERRNILTESARIARGEILDLAQTKPERYDALVMPGGFGVAKSHCSFAFKGAEAEVRPDVAAFIRGFIEAGKPVGAICIAPALLALTLAGLGKGGTLTIGNDAGCAGALEKLGSRHERHDSSREIAVDDTLNLVSTPAYMFGEARISEVAIGIERLVTEVLKRVKAPVGA